VQRHYFDLAVLPEDTAIPETALEVLWELDGKTVRATAALLASRSLATRDTLGRLALHDLQLDYVRKRAGKLADLHCRLLQRYRKRCSGGWHTGPNDGYFFEHLAYHLKEGRRVEELGSLLLDFDWMREKLEMTNVTAGRPNPALSLRVARSLFPLGESSNQVKRLRQNDHRARMAVPHH